MLLWTALHILAAIVWVGGMFFAHMVLRPAALDLEPPLRLALWRRTLQRFFAWVWLSLVLLLGSGYAMVVFELGGFADLSLSVNLMQAIGLVMAVLFVFLWLRPWAAMRRALDAGDLTAAAAAQAVIRRIVATNLTLGLITSLIGTTGRYWPT